MQNAPAPWIYTVHLTIEVDAPHLRDATFPRVPAGHRVTWRVQGARSEALAMYEAALAGRWDYLSEFVASVAVTATRAGKGRRVRARVDRATPDVRRYRREEQRHAEQVAQIRRESAPIHVPSAHVDS